MYINNFYWKLILSYNFRPLRNIKVASVHTSCACETDFITSYLTFLIFISFTITFKQVLCIWSTTFIWRKKIMSFILGYLLCIIILLCLKFYNRHIYLHTLNVNKVYLNVQFSLYKTFKANLATLKDRTILKFNELLFNCH